MGSTSSFYILKNEIMTIKKEKKRKTIQYKCNPSPPFLQPQFQCLNNLKSNLVCISPEMYEQTSTQMHTEALFIIF